MNNNLSWDVDSLPDELKSFCNQITERFDIQLGKTEKGIEVEFRQAKALGAVEVLLRQGHATISYDKPHHAARGLGALLSGLVAEDSLYSERMQFDKLGIMLDCSRNAVMTVEHIKTWLTQMSLLGYNTMMLYMEETYELPGEPYFGYLRGRYTPDELKEIDRYASELNIELIGCIQTLGHLWHLLKWPAYTDVKDTAAVMLVDNDATYNLIDRMITHFSEMLTSRRIHIGMDETFDLGLGKFLELNGYQKSRDLYARHLQKVTDICRNHEMKPMIWSDMYFRKGMIPDQNYDPDTVISEDMKASIPADVQLVFWEYYKGNEKFYLDLIEKHRQLGKEPAMASGIWTWHRFWYDHKLTTENALPCISAAKKAKLKELFFTMWGDGGAFCEFDSAVAGLACCAEAAYVDGKLDEEKLETRVHAVCGISYKAIIKISKLNQLCNVSTYVWDDPLLGVEWKERKKDKVDYWQDVLNTCKELAKDTKCYEVITQPVDFAYAYNLVLFLTDRIETSILLEKAYSTRNQGELADVQKRIPLIEKRIDDLLGSFRRQWLHRNKPFGVELIQEKFGGLRQRYKELEYRLDELREGLVELIPELEETP